MSTVNSPTPVQSLLDGITLFFPNQNTLKLLGVNTIILFPKHIYRRKLNSFVFLVFFYFCVPCWLIDWFPFLVALQFAL